MATQQWNFGLFHFLFRFLMCIHLFNGYYFVYEHISFGTHGDWRQYLPIVRLSKLLHIGSEINDSFSFIPNRCLTSVMCKHCFHQLLRRNNWTCLQYVESQIYLTTWCSKPLICLISNWEMFLVLYAERQCVMCTVVKRQILALAYFRQFWFYSYEMWW